MHERELLAAATVAPCTPVPLKLSDTLLTVSLMSRVASRSRLRVGSKLLPRPPPRATALGLSRRFPAAHAPRTVPRPTYCLPHHLAQQTTTADSARETVPFEVPQDAMTLLLAHKMLGISSFRRIVSQAQQLVIRAFADQRFNAKELTAGARYAYEAVTNLAFGQHEERDHELLRQLVSEKVATRMIDAASYKLASVVTVHHIMAAEIIAVRMVPDTDPDATDSKGRPFPTRMFFDVRFLACESVLNSGACCVATRPRLP